MKNFFQPTKFKIVIFILILTAVYFTPVIETCEESFEYDKINGSFDQVKKCQKGSILYILREEPFINSLGCSVYPSFCQEEIKITILKLCLALIYIVIILFILYLFSCFSACCVKTKK